MADPLQNVTPGQMVPTGAGTWNAIIESARDYRGRRGRRTGGAGQADPFDPAVYALVQFDSSPSDTLEAFSIQAYGSVFQDVAESPFEAQARPAFVGATPADAAAPFAVTVEPIPGDGLGRAVVAGVAHVWLMVTDAAHRFARPVTGETDYLESATSGVPILWVDAAAVDEEHEDTYWARVLLGGSGGGATLDDLSDALTDALTACDPLFGLSPADCPTYTVARRGGACAKVPFQSGAFAFDDTVSTAAGMRTWVGEVSFRTDPSDPEDEESAPTKEGFLHLTTKGGPKLVLADAPGGTVLYTFEFAGCRNGKWRFLGTPDGACSGSPVATCGDNTFAVDVACGACEGVTCGACEFPKKLCLTFALVPGQDVPADFPSYLGTPGSGVTLTYDHTVPPGDPTSGLWYYSPLYGSGSVRSRFRLVIGCVDDTPTLYLTMTTNGGPSMACGGLILSATGTTDCDLAGTFDVLNGCASTPPSPYVFATLTIAPVPAEGCGTSGSGGGGLGDGSGDTPEDAEELLCGASASPTLPAGQSTYYLITHAGGGDDLEVRLWELVGNPNLGTVTIYGGPTTGDGVIATDTSTGHGATANAGAQPAGTYLVEVRNDGPSSPFLVQANCILPAPPEFCATYAVTGGGLPAGLMAEDGSDWEDVGTGWTLSRGGPTTWSLANSAGGGTTWSATGWDGTGAKVFTPDGDYPAATVACGDTATYDCVSGECVLNEDGIGEFDSPEECAANCGGGCAVPECWTASAELTAGVPAAGSATSSGATKYHVCSASASVSFKVTPGAGFLEIVSVTGYGADCAPGTGVDTSGGEVCLTVPTVGGVAMVSLGAPAVSPAPYTITAYEGGSCS